jgi:hypothetical protein
MPDEPPKNAEPLVGGSASRSYSFYRCGAYLCASGSQALESGSEAAFFRSLSSPYRGSAHGYRSDLSGSIAAQAVPAQDPAQPGASTLSERAVRLPCPERKSSM